MFDLNKFANNIAVITDRGETMTYAELDLFTREFQAHIPSPGLAFCLCENRLGSLAGYVAALNNNLPLVLVDGAKNIDLLQRLTDIYSPEYIWIPTERISEVGGDTIFTFASYSLQQMKYEKEVEKVEIYKDLALCLTTSGSTGSPKLVRLTKANLLANAESIAEYLQINSEERPITTLPMHYSYGVSVINSHLISGATLLLTDKTVMQKELWTFCKEQNATSISGVPYTYEMLKRLRFFRMDLPALKTMTQAGGKLKAELAKEYIDAANAAGKRFFVMYGQTEATARMSYLPWNVAATKPGSIGIAIPRGEFSLIDVDGNLITEPDKDGELIYRGANVSLGYAECRADLAKGDERHGELHTGDVARRDSDGYYYITGRLKRFVKIWGNRCNLDATEQLVKDIITNCACAGVDDKITIFVTEPGLEKSIIDMLSEKTGLNSKAFAVKIIESIPKNSSGKIQYAELQKMLD